MDFQIPKWEFALLDKHYQISKNEGNQNFKLSAPAWFLQKLAKILNQPTHLSASLLDHVYIKNDFMDNVNMLNF